MFSPRAATPLGPSKTFSKHANVLRTLNRGGSWVSIRIEHVLRNDLCFDLAINEGPDWMEVRCAIKIGICEHSKHCPFLIIAEDYGLEWCGLSCDAFLSLTRSYRKVLVAGHKHDGHRLGSEEIALPGMPVDALRA